MFQAFSSIPPDYKFKIPDYNSFGITADQRADLAKAVASRLLHTPLSKRSVQTLFRDIKTFWHDKYEIDRLGTKQKNPSFIEELALHIDIALSNQRANRLRFANGEPITVIDFFFTATNRSKWLPIESLHNEPLWPLKDSTWKTILEGDCGFGWKSVFPLIVIGSLSDITEHPCPTISSKQSVPKPEAPKELEPEVSTTEGSSRQKSTEDYFSAAAENLRRKGAVLSKFIDRLQEIGQDDELRNNLITLINPENRAFRIRPDYYDAAEANLKRKGEISDGFIHRILELCGNEELRKNILTIIAPDPNWTYTC